MKESKEKNDEAPGQNKEFNIMVNGRSKSFTGREITFQQVIELAAGNAPSHDRTAYTVTYMRGEGNKPEGSIVEGESVKVKEGMIFNATPTDKS